MSSRDETKMTWEEEKSWVAKSLKQKEKWGVGVKEKKKEKKILDTGKESKG